MDLLSESMSRIIKKDIRWKNQIQSNKPHKQFYEIQEEFMQRGFMELKNYIQQQINEHFQLKKREEFHKVKCDINLEKIEIDSVTLFTVNGDKIESLKEIQLD